MVPTGYASVPVKVCENGLGPGDDCVMVAGSVAIEITDIGIEKRQEMKPKAKPVEPGSRGRSRWTSFTSGLMALCQFGTSRTASSPEPTILGLNKTPISSTKVGNSTEVRSDADAVKSPDTGKITKARKSVEFEKRDSHPITLQTSHSIESNHKRATANVK